MKNTKIQLGKVMECNVQYRLFLHICTTKKLCGQRHGSCQNGISLSNQGLETKPILVVVELL